MLKVFYFADDFFATAYPFDSFVMQFMDGSRWIHDAAQRQRVDSLAYRQCEQKAWHPDVRLEWSSSGLSRQQILPALKEWCQEKEADLVLYTADPVFAEQAHALSIPLGDSQKKLDQTFASMDQADSMYNRVYSQSGLLEKIVAEHLVGRVFEDFEGGQARIERVLHMEIEYGEDDNSAIIPTEKGADVRKYYFIKALAATDTEEEASPRRFKIWVHALYYKEGEGRFKLLAAEN